MSQAAAGSVQATFTSSFSFLHITNRGNCEACRPCYFVIYPPYGFVICFLFRLPLSTFNRSVEETLCSHGILPGGTQFASDHSPWSLMCARLAHCQRILFPSVISIFVGRVGGKTLCINILFHMHFMVPRHGNFDPHRTFGNVWEHF